MSLAQVPNLLCVLRILLVLPVAKWTLDGRYPAVMALFAIAAFTDGLDGFLAKRFGWATELGKHLDPLADKVLLVTLFVCLSLVGAVPWLLTALVLLRDVVIVFGAIGYRTLVGPVNGHPTWPSKFNTFTQIVFCFATVAAAAYRWPDEPVLTALGALVVVTTGISGIDYVTTYARRAAAETVSARATSRG